MSEYHIRWDPTNKKREVSIDGGAFVDLIEKSRSVRVYNSADISVNDATQTLITFDTESWDSDAFHSVSSNTSRLIVPTGLAGKYRYDLNILWDGPATPAGYRSIAVTKNTSGTFDGSAVVQRVYIQPVTVASTVTQHHLSGIVDLAEGDHLEAWVIHTQGATLLVKAGATAGQTPAFSMSLIGA